MPLIKDALGLRWLSQMSKIWCVLIRLCMKSNLSTFWGQWLSLKRPQKLLKFFDQECFWLTIQRLPSCAIWPKNKHLPLDPPWEAPLLILVVPILLLFLTLVYRTGLFFGHLVARDRQLPDQFKWLISLVRRNSLKNIIFKLFIEILRTYAFYREMNCI